MPKSSWLPIPLTPMAHQIDSLFYLVLGIVAFFFVLVEALLITFLIRYRRTKRNRVGVNVHGNNKLEIIWTLIPAIILVSIGVISLPDVYAEQTPPTTGTPYIIHVIGHEWSWEFKYPNGVDLQDDLRIPAGQNVLFEITSADVVHGFYMPVARIQQDAVPGRQTEFWVNANAQYIATPAEYGKQFLVPCDQFCGLGHPLMDAYLTVMSPSDFQSWLNSELHKQQAANASSSSTS